MWNQEYPAIASGSSKRAMGLRRIFIFILVIASAAILASGAANRARKLLVVSVDGLDWRYLRDADRLHLKIPSIRNLMTRGRYAQGVIGVYPTITWPSHTSLITGVRPSEHGILGNRRPKDEGGDYYWSVDLLKAQTLWMAAHKRGLTTASVTWPVTAGADIDFNLPEYFARRNGGSMDLASVSAKGTPGLANAIAAEFPSFPQQWIDDRTRTQAVRFLLKEKRPDLILVHLVDLDSEEHDQGPFSENADAVLERTDELIAGMRRDLPPDYDFALVSDHGFERVDRTANLAVLLKSSGVSGEVVSLGGVGATASPRVAAFLRQAAKDPLNGIGREIPRGELLRYAPQLAAMEIAFEPAPHVMFGTGTRGEFLTTPQEKGNHGFWPLRPDYRSVFVIGGPGIEPGIELEMEMTAVAGRLAALLGFEFPPPDSAIH